MKLALRSTASASATWPQRAFADLTRWRLVSQWCHGGIVIGDVMYQSNAAHGLHSTTDWSPEKWDLFDLGDARNADALTLFQRHHGAGYDFAGVLGFGLPVVRGSEGRLYCFEWCAMAMGLPAQRWMTPERLLLAALNPA